MVAEKEIRYKIEKEKIALIKSITKEHTKKITTLDITCGYDGFNSLAKNHYICRIRQKGEKITLEVKNYKNKNECLEQSINLESVTDGLNYLTLIGMNPYLYLKREREIRTYKGLKIFIDEFDILGTYIEIEYQDSNNSIEEIKEFLNIIKIDETPQELYGDIVKEKLKNDQEFSEEFNKQLNKLLQKK